MEEEKGADWANLPDGLLEDISDRLGDDIDDHVCFGAVCKRWHSAASRCRHPPQLPWLMLRRDYKTSNQLFFISLANPEAVRSITLPALEGKFFSVSCNGWLLLEGAKGSSISLLDPLTGVEIHLPTIPPTHLIDTSPFDSCKSYECALYRRGRVRAIAMSSDPLASSAQDCTIMLVAGDMCLLSLHLRRPGKDDKDANKWVRVNIKKCITDVIYFKDCFYALQYRLTSVTVFDSNLKLVACSLSFPALSYPTYNCGCFKGAAYSWCDRHWFCGFLELSGELHVVARDVISGVCDIVIYKYYKSARALFPVDLQDWDTNQTIISGIHRPVSVVSAADHGLHEVNTRVVYGPQCYGKQIFRLCDLEKKIALQPVGIIRGICENFLPMWHSPRFYY